MLLDRFLEYLDHERRFSPHTVAAYGADIRLLMVHLAEQGVARIEDCDDGLLRYWVMARMESGDSPRTVSRRLSSVKGLFKYAQQVGALAHDPTELIEGPKHPKRLPEFVDKKRMDDVFTQERASNDRHGLEDLVMEILYGTGIRLAELVGLNQRDIDRGNATMRVLGKRNKERIIPLGDAVMDALRRYEQSRDPEPGLMPGDSPLLVGAKGQRLSRSTVQRIVRRRLGEVTTQGKRSPHVLRHTFATHMLDRGADLSAVKDLLFFDDTATTEIYTHNTSDRLKRAHEKAHPRGSRRTS